MGLLGIVIQDTADWLVRIPDWLRALRTIPRRLRAFFANPQTRREGIGYVVWTIALVIFAVPEIAAAANSRMWFTTFSGVIGHAEEVDDWVSIIVVFVLVACVLHAVRVTAGHLPSASLSSRDREQAGARVRTNQARALHVVPSEGRLSRGQDFVEIEWWHYLGFALLVVIAGALVPLPFTSDRHVRGAALFGAIGLVFFLVPGLLAYAYGRFVPFPTLFRTFLNAERRWKVFTAVVAAGLTFLTLHLVFYPWPSIIPTFPDLQAFHEHCRELIAAGHHPPNCHRP
jgi:hypothetical protein